MKRAIAAVLVSAALCGCSNSQKFEMGTYGYDAEFLSRQGISTIELKSQDGQARVLVAPGLQGRVMTSATGGLDSPGFGWINHAYIESGQRSDQFNPFGGEERFWLGPEGGPFSLYFPQGSEQVYANWVVPSALDTESFEVESADRKEAVFTRKMMLRNASGTAFDIDVKRTVSLLDREELGSLLGVEVPESMEAVAYRTENIITNAGDSPWTAQTGMPSIWLLGMFSPTPTTTVFIPFDPESAGRAVNDEYFGKIPADRLVIGEGMVYFRIDGQYRSKLGLPKGSAKDVCGSYDSAEKVLTILKYTVPQGECSYVNGQWGPQDDPFNGDVINSYNDGPTETGTVMGPFYEVETSSPAAALDPSESLVHTQCTIHLKGDEKQLDAISVAVFGVGLDKVSSIFRK